MNSGADARTRFREAAVGHQLPSTPGQIRAGVLDTHIIGKLRSLRLYLANISFIVSPYCGHSVEVKPGSSATTR